MNVSTIDLGLLLELVQLMTFVCVKTLSQGQPVSHPSYQSQLHHVDKGLLKLNSVAAATWRLEVQALQCQMDQQILTCLCQVKHTERGQGKLGVLLQQCAELMPKRSEPSIWKNKAICRALAELQKLSDQAQHSAARDCLGDLDFQKFLAK